ncbi:hypothetical protein CRUP_035666 [Coryphaenoides rupestris]|nr:hypothetical protein CRUP_035666 [Coryphaenoides rupestris]
MVRRKRSKDEEEERSTVLTHTKRFTFFMPTLPCLVAFCQAFPPLYDDVAALLLQVGQVCASDVATKARDIDPLIAPEPPTGSDRNNPAARAAAAAAVAAAAAEKRPVLFYPIFPDTDSLARSR